ncbi:MAG TPA: MlaD family protein [Flavobacteriales bacterium]|nr:MlaD family protein [Flavobacteriales bacterium]
MENSTSRNIKLGFFVIAAAVLLISALYFIGNKQNMFGSTFRIKARFYNVNGLMQGNNVRFGGIDVGTVEDIEIINDTSISVTMIIEKEVQQYIKKNAIATIGSDGLMGNKLVDINGGTGQSKPIEENDVLRTLKPIEMDETIRTLNATNENIHVISNNLRNITDKINSPNSFWSLLLDTVIPTNVKSTLVNLKIMSNQAVYVTGDLREITRGFKAGKGTIGALITDTTFARGFNQTVVNIKTLGDSAAVITGNISSLIAKLNKGEGTVGMLLNDTNLIHNLNKGIHTLQDGAGNFNENMEALKYSWPFKKYFRKKSKNKLKK